MSIIQEMSMIRENVKLIKQFAEIPEIAVLKSTMILALSELDSRDEAYEDKCAEVVKSSDYYIRMEGCFPSFSKEFEALFIMVLRDFDLGPLEFMLSTMEGIASGTVSKDKGEMAIGEHLAEKFIKSNKPNKPNKSNKSRK